MESARRVHVIACGVLAIDLKAVAEGLGLAVSMEFLPGGLHSTPHELRRRLQEAIDDASSSRQADLIAFGYGVCGRGTVGIHARTIPLAFPRVQDCIALFLGSDAAYREQFARFPGTYYISAGWAEEKVRPRSGQEDQAEGGGPADSEVERLIEQYGQENAEAIRYFLSSWQRNYQRAAFIDTGVAGQKRKHADIARVMAREFGWTYEELPGTHELLVKLLTARRASAEVLLVPPHHVTTYDSLGKGLKAVPIWSPDSHEEHEKVGADRTHTLVFSGGGQADAANEGPSVRLGLGIDAGGTYTDVVVYDFQRREVLDKAKALTTPWDFTVGIGSALDQLQPARLKRVDLVALSTTLATNAIVEGRGQKVGLLVMPPYGLFEPSDVTHRPLAVIDGKLEIDGTEIAPIDPEQVRRVVRDMVERQGVGAFAVCGYASHNNPEHELQVKATVREETGLSVTCGHDVSELLNYRIRAQTAALNARIIPCLEALLDHVQASLGRRGIEAPVMVVKSDGSLTTMGAARRRPIETILSGPAASVAGASHLTKCRDAIVVDVGGTTTDVALISGGVVRTCYDGATVGGWRTHVKALDMRTLGLGGDSLITYEKGRLRIGPRRVAPVSWLASQQRAGTGLGCAQSLAERTSSADGPRGKPKEAAPPRTGADGPKGQPESVRMGGQALDWLERHLDSFDTSTRGMDLMALNGRERGLPLSEEERRIVEELAGGPLSLHELGHRVRDGAWQFLCLSRLEEHHLVQRCGLTPTDLLHDRGRLRLWDARASRRLCGLFSQLMGVSRDEFADQVMGQVVRGLTVELLKKQLDEETEGESIESSPGARALVDNMLAGGSEGYRVRVVINRPLIGIGAPVHFFLPQAAKMLETEAVIPVNADVANAIGAITSSVSVHKRARISPDEAGRYVVQGLPEAPTFVNFEDAHRFAVEELQRSVREMGRRAGTSEGRVEIVVDDSVVTLGYGDRLFVGRTLEAWLSGRPDITRLAGSP